MGVVRTIIQDLVSWDSEIADCGGTTHNLGGSHRTRAALYEWNVNGEDSYFKELDKRYEAGFFNTDLFGHNPEWDEGEWENCRYADAQRAAF